MDELDFFRKQMPVTSRWIYLNHASIGPLPLKTYSAASSNVLNKHLNGLDEEPIANMLETFEKMQKIGAKILGTNDYENVYFPTSTHIGIITAIEGLNLEEKGNIVLTDMEFSQNSFPYQVLAKRTGRELRAVSSHNGMLPIESFEKQIDDNTRIVAVSHVQYSNGFMVDLNELSKLCEEHGAFLIVDAIQSLGAVPFKADKWKVDAVTAGGYKWLLGPFGTGLGYISPEWSERLEPILAGWLSDRDYMNMTHHPYQPLKGGRRFQPHLNSMMMTLIYSLELLVEVGIDKIRKRTLELGRKIIELADELSFSLKSPRDKNQRGAIVNVGVPNAEQVSQQLLKNRVSVSLRDGGIRFSPHGYNTVEEIEYAFDILNKITKN